MRALALYNDKQMTKLYRQLAKQLHPDKGKRPMNPRGDVVNV
jgi:DnaJ-class molecular chaperone